MTSLVDVEQLKQLVQGEGKSARNILAFNVPHMVPTLISECSKTYYKVNELPNKLIHFHSPKSVHKKTSINPKTSHSIERLSIKN